MMSLGARAGLVFLASLMLAACARGPLATLPPQDRAQIEAALMRDIATLSSDEFGGRKPGTLGEERTIAFITEEMQKAGLTSGTNDPGSAWRAPVELISTQPFTGKIALRLGGREVVFPEESSAAFTIRRRALVEGAEAVFVGKEAEKVPMEAVAGKIVIMLGEPGVSPARRANLFEKNPAAIITVVEDDEAIARMKRGFARERILLKSDDNFNLSGYVTNAAMANALGAPRWQNLLNSAEEESFAFDVLTRATATIEATSQRREFTSYNILGRIDGTKRGAGAVLLMGHWDHLGECRSEGEEDRICNGAVDNASGIAVMLELSRRLAASGPYDRDIYVLATTAEEAGLLGARAFVETPSVPLDSIVAAFNFDTVAIAPAGSPVGFVGEGQTALDSLIFDVMQKGERQLGNSEFAEQFLRRQDGWSLLQQGVPAVFLTTAFGSEITTTEYLTSKYHGPDDEIEGIELGGAIDDLLLHEALVKRTASTADYMPDAR